MPKKRDKSVSPEHEREPAALSLTTPPAPKPTQRIARRPDFASYYASSTGFFSTTFDISFIFGKIEAGEDGKLFIDQFAKVTMSYQHAKAVAIILAKTIEQYEAKNGPLNVKLETETTTAE